MTTKSVSAHTTVELITHYKYSDLETVQQKISELINLKNRTLEQTVTLIELSTLKEGLLKYATGD